MTKQKKPPAALLEKADSVRRRVNNVKAAAGKSAKTRSNFGIDPEKIARPGKEPRRPRAGLRALSDEPGVFLNETGQRVDSNGVLLSLGRSAGEQERLDARRILGKELETPAEYLKRVALDPDMPHALRIDAAKAAAPYFDKKQPIAIENRNEDFALDVAVLAGLPKEERQALLEQLRKVGLDLAAELPK